MQPPSAHHSSQGQPRKSEVSITRARRKGVDGIPTLAFLIEKVTALGLVLIISKPLWRSTRENLAGSKYQRCSRSKRTND